MLWKNSLKKAYVSTTVRTPTLPEKIEIFIYKKEEYEIKNAVKEPRSHRPFVPVGPTLPSLFSLYTYKEERLREGYGSVSGTLSKFSLYGT
jgi:hypothetical protein